MRPNPMILGSKRNHLQNHLGTDGSSTHALHYTLQRHIMAPCKAIDLSSFILGDIILGSMHRWEASLNHGSPVGWLCRQSPRSGKFPFLCSASRMVTLAASCSEGSIDKPSRSQQDQRLQIFIALGTGANIVNSSLMLINKHSRLQVAAELVKEAANVANLQKFFARVAILLLLPHRDCRCTLVKCCSDASKEQLLPICSHRELPVHTDGWFIG